MAAEPDITGRRLSADLAAAARFSATENGVTRLAWSDELAVAHAWLADRMTELGLEVTIDAAGNVLGKWQACAKKALLVGSHFDTVQQGGAYDGALGVLGGLEALRILRETGFEPSRPIWLVSFMDEEGPRFGTTFLGSRAFIGDDLATLGERQDAQGVTLREAMAARGFDFERLPQARAIDQVEAYVELHIEQGPVLESEAADIGVVTGIVGLVGARARFVGRANHAGTTPMPVRRDALVGAARSLIALRDMARSRRNVTANVGSIVVEPGSPNVVPGTCRFTVDVRTADESTFTVLPAIVAGILGPVAQEEGLELDMTHTYTQAPVRLDAALGDQIEAAARAEGLQTLRIVSGAGHDAMILARHVPAAMLFVPSRGGVSHAPDEFTDDRHCAYGARVLARVIAEVAA